MQRFRALIAYDGTHYFGFQRQRVGQVTIQSTLEDALSALADAPVTITGAGRTDSGVHALGQVISFDLAWRHGEEALRRALNVNLPADIVVKQVEITPPDFHPRGDARRRAYRYQIFNHPVRSPIHHRYSWHVSQPLDVSRMNAAAAILLGSHDFATFGLPPQGTNTVREIYRSQWDTKPTQYGIMHEYRIEATAFLQHMVRRIVSSLIAVGQGTLTIAQFSGALTSGEMLDGVTLAPPHGLVLEAVRYPTDEQLMGRRGRRPPEEI